MTTTLQVVQAKQAELAALIAQLTAQATTKLLIAECVIEIRVGEHYAGAVLAEDGTVKHHLVLMAARPDERLDWQAAIDWATSVGGALPDRQEQALLFANCKPHLEAAWHWSSQEHESNASYAWFCYFFHGYHFSSHKSADGCAVAVRRVS